MSQKSPSLSFLLKSYYNPQMKLRGGNVFTGVCQSFSSLGTGWVHVLLGVSLVPDPFKGMGMSGWWVCSWMARSQGRYVPGVCTQPSDMRHQGVSTIPPSRTWDTT